MATATTTPSAPPRLPRRCWLATTCVIRAPARFSDDSALTVCLAFEPPEALLRSDPASATSLPTLF